MHANGHKDLYSPGYNNELYANHVSCSWLIKVRSLLPAHIVCKNPLSIPPHEFNDGELI